MEFRERIASSGAAAIVALLLTVGATTAHAGEAHAAESPDGFGGRELLVAAIVAGIGFWVANRGDLHPTRLGATERSGAEVVLADGRFVSASESQHADLWMRPGNGELVRRR